MPHLRWFLAFLAFGLACATPPRTPAADGEATVAGSHSTNRGFARQVEAFLPVLTSLLAPPEKPPEPALAPPVRTIDLKVGEPQEVELAGGKKVAVKLLDLQETRDDLRKGVRRAEVQVEVDGQKVSLVSANYRLPVTVGAVQIDCPVTRGYLQDNSKGVAGEDPWGLDKDARLRLWPAGSPLINPGTFVYPVKQRWFASGTQMANEPVHVDGGENPLVKKIYYHYGLDIGGAEGLVEVIAATEGLVVSSGKAVLPGYENSPVQPRYDVIYVLDERGWYYRYSHLHTIGPDVTPGARVKMGQRLGLLGKEGGSGGWSHLHFDISGRQPSGKWGIIEGYAFLWEAYLKEYQPKLLAVARPHHLAAVGQKVVLDGSRSWSAAGKIASFEWTFTDGKMATGATVERTYARPGVYSEVLKVADSEGRIDYDFAVVNVLDPEHPDQLPPSIHAVYNPTVGIGPGDPVTFLVRTFRTTDGKETWDFGDGSPKVEVQSDGNVVPLAKDGYARTVHRYEKAGHYLVRVERTDRRGFTAVAHLHVRVGEDRSRVDLRDLSKIKDVQAAEGSRVGVVSHLLVVSDKVPDVSSMEAWQKAFLKEGMTDQEKALAAWRTTVMFQHQDVPPREYLQNEEVIHDPIKMFNVYGYSFCSAASCDVEALARYAGLKARGWAINGHSVPEVYWDGGWHLLDGSLINYFPKADGTIASVEEVMAAVKEWYDEHPEYRGNDAKLQAFQRAEGWAGWKKGPALLARSPFYDAGGWWPAHTHGWYATMQEYDGTYGKNGKPYLYEYGYSQGYQVNIQLRHGERLTRNWGNKGLHINGQDGGAPGCLTEKTGAGSLVYTPEYGDLAPGRVGNGTLVYDVPLTGGAYRPGALAVDNLDERAVRVKDASRPGMLVLRMPSSYVYLSGTLNCTTAVGTGGSIVVSLSDNNGLDWQEIAHWTSSGEQRVDLTSRVLRRYDYRVKFEFHGKDTGLDALRIMHDIQHSQRPLPALAKGENAITFTAGAPEGTVTVEGATNLASKGKQLVYTDFHPEMSGFDPNLFIGSSGQGTITFPIATPGNLVRLRFGAHYRARDARDGLDYQVSFNGGKTWKTVERAAGPTPGDCKYTIVTDVPAGTREALVRFRGTSRNATGLFNFRIDADYREPEGGFCPVKVTYTWEENGQPKQDVHVARRPQETYTITCAAKPVMKAIVMELAE